MPKHNEHNSSYELPKKKPSGMGNNVSLCGEIITDKFGKKWKLGRAVGNGGFGEIYLVSDILNEEVKTDAPYVAKFEPHESGPLFVEINCYLRIAKTEMINEWKEKQKTSNLGMPHYVASGSYCIKNAKYRFLILPRFKTDLEKMLNAKQKLNLKTVLTISRQILDVLQYIHEKGYIHSDIKASNILIEKSKNVGEVTPSLKRSKTLVRYSGGFNPMRTCKVRRINKFLRPNNSLRYISFNEEIVTKVEKTTDQIYLLDYGLASKYRLSNGEHKPYCIDERKAHAGTLLFCSRDAHNGAQARRSDLESLGYNMIYWLTSSLPWSMDVDDPMLVYKKKKACAENIHNFLKQCFTNVPEFLYEYFQYLETLDFEAEPNYKYCRNLFRNALKDYNYNDDSKFDFENLEGNGRLIKKTKWTENVQVKRKITCKIKRSPLKSNLPIKPILRKKNLKNKPCRISWSKIITDPEMILKRKTKERKSTEANEATPINEKSDSYLLGLNPTYAMIEVFNKCKERTNNYCGHSPAYKGDCLVNQIDGYTPAMMAVYKKLIERKELELEQTLVRTVRTRKKTANKRICDEKLMKNSYVYLGPLKTQIMKPASSAVKDSVRKKPLLKRTYSLRG